MLLNLVKIYWKPTAETKRSYPYRILIFCINTLPLAAIIIGANIAWRAHQEAGVRYNPIKDKLMYFDTALQQFVNDPADLFTYYATKLKIVGFIPSGFNILRTPTFKYPWGSFFLDVLPLTMINYMEAYSVARRIASERNELHILNANQELYALGLGNLLGCVATSYPVTGSYSRSALNNAAGARTPFSKVIALFVVLLALGVMTPYFFYIPSAALSAIIWVAIFNLINFTDLWHAWKFSKGDFVVMLITLVFTFVYETSIGLAVGIGASFAVQLYFMIFSPVARPSSVDFSRGIINDTVGSGDVQVVTFNGDITFLTSANIVEYFEPFFLLIPPTVEKSDSMQEYYFQQISKRFDKFFGKERKPREFPTPLLFVLDFSKVIFVDLTGMQALEEVLKAGRAFGVKFSFVNFVQATGVEEKLLKYGIKPDNLDVDLEQKEVDFA